jgi:hypothetical protein
LESVKSGSGPTTRLKLPPDPYGDDEPRPGRGRRPLILIGVLAALFLVIALVNRNTHHSPAAQASGQPSAPTSSSTESLTTPQGAGLPTNSADQVPIGYPHTSAGAESAAANYVVAYTTSSMVGSNARHHLIDVIADPAIATSLQEQLDTAYRQANSGYGLSDDGAPPSGQTFVQRSAPMGVALVSYGGDNAVVSVWAVTIAGLAGQGSTHPVAEGWSTVKVVLHWTQGDWKWVSFDSTDGPVPTSGQQLTSSGQALQNAVDQFGGLRYAH